MTRRTPTAHEERVPLLASVFGNGKLRPLTQVPHLAGLTQAQAEEQLRDGASVEPGTPVTLYVGAEPEPQEEGDEHGDQGKGKGKGGG